MEGQRGEMENMMVVEGGTSKVINGGGSKGMFSKQDGKKGDPVLPEAMVYELKLIRKESDWVPL